MISNPLSFKSKDFDKFFTENASIMLLIDVATGHIVDSNKSAANFYEYTHEQLCSLNISDLNMLPKDKVHEQTSGIYSRKIINPYYKHITANKVVKDIRVLATPIEMNGRKLNFAIIHDVTDLKIKEDESNRFKKIADHAIPFIGFANMKREVTYFNRSMRSAFAIPENADLSTFAVYDFYTDKGKEIIKKVFAEILEQGYWQGENEMQSLDGRIYQVHQTIVLIRDEEGMPQFTSSTAIDITKVKLTEQKIAAMAIRYKTLLQNAAEGIHIIDNNLKLIEANDAFCKMLGYLPEEVLQLHVTDWDAQHNKDELTKMLKQLLNQTALFETKHRRKDGSFIDVEINASGIIIADQEYLYASARDITQRKLIEKKLQSSELKLRAILDNSFDAIGVHVNGFWEMCNPAALKLFGYSKPQDLIGTSILNVIDPSEHEKIKTKVKKRITLNENSETYLTIGLKKDGARFDMEVSLSSFVQNKQVHVMVILRDISERRRKDAAVSNLNKELKELNAHLQKVRLEERNKLAKEVHDKLGQRLVGVKFQLDFLRKELQKTPSPVLDRITPISKEIEAILHNFIDIYTGVNPALIDDFEIYDSLNFLINVFPQNDNFKINFSTNTENCAFTHEIKWCIYKTSEECLNNIIRHANAKQVAISLNKSDKTLILEIQDDGVGFDVTKVDFKKQLGIIEMRERIMAAGGKINIHSAVGMGTLIKVSLDI
jgi:PAS domain S-box-containing protein